MPTLPVLLSFVVASFAVVIVPGLTVSAVVSSALARGFGAGLWTEAGVQFGRFTMILVVAFALETVSAVMAVAYEVIKYAGAAYLIWLGWGYLTQRHTIEIDRGNRGATGLHQAISGFVVLWSNPKALLFFGAFLPQFVDRAHAIWPQVIVLGLIEMAAGLIVDTGYIAIAAKSRDALKGRTAALVNRVAGVILIAAALWLAFQP